MTCLVSFDVVDVMLTVASFKAATALPRPAAAADELLGDIDYAIRVCHANAAPECIYAHSSDSDNERTRSTHSPGRSSTPLFTVHRPPASTPWQVIGTPARRGVAVMERSVGGGTVHMACFSSKLTEA